MLEGEVWSSQGDVIMPTSAEERASQPQGSCHPGWSMPSPSCSPRSCPPFLIDIFKRAWAQVLPHHKHAFPFVPALPAVPGMPQVCQLLCCRQPADSGPPAWGRICHISRRDSHHIQAARCASKWQKCGFALLTWRGASCALRYAVRTAAPCLLINLPVCIRHPKTSSQWVKEAVSMNCRTVIPQSPGELGAPRG